MPLTVKDRNFDPDFPLLMQGARLYTLARTDITQMNAGKLAAQAAHAATQFVFDAINWKGDQDSELVKQMHEWRAQGGGGVGTKITLAATEAEVKESVAFIKSEFDLATGLVVDPTYPMTNVFGTPFTREELTSLEPLNEETKKLLARVFEG